MKTLLAYIRVNDFMALDECRIRSKNFDRIVLVGCDHTVGACHWNACGDKLKCYHCKHIMKSFITPLLKEYSNFVYLSFSDLINKDIKKEANSILFNYKDVSDLKAIRYHEVDVGFGAFSTFATATRNVMPTFNETLHDYLDFLMRSEVRMTLVWEKLIDEYKPDLIIFHNGRFNNFKPLYCIANSRGLHYIATETLTFDGIMRKNNFENTIPHAYSALTEKINYAGEKCKDKLEVIGKSFYEKRRNAKPSGDKVFTINQKKGMLPDGFNYEKCNIAIFNSSEDEEFALSYEYDRSRLYENQYVGLRRIFEHYKTDAKIHFYLRIHPNLKNVPYKSHTNLYKLEYDNVTVIPPTSPISSYALVDACDKIIVFGSTIGAEASYWGKPVINLARTFYSDFDVVYSPKSEVELFKLIESAELKPKGAKQDFYKIGAYCLGYHYDDFVYYKQRIRHWHGTIYELKKVLGSYRINKIIDLMIDKISRYHGNGRRFKDLGKRTC